MATTTATTSANGAILQSLGIGSGIDINSLVTQLVTADTSAGNSRIARETQQVGTQISAMGQLKGALASFQSALNTLNSATDFQAKSAVSTDNEVYTAIGSSGAAPGNYQIEVVHLAQAQQILSKPFVGGAAAIIGSGALTLSVGGKSFTVNITDDHKTLGDIRDAINSASDNTGISATIVNGAAGSQLVLSANQSGAANKITVASDTINQLVYNPDLTTNYTQFQAAQDSEINIAGVNHKSPTNTVTDAIDGVTLNLLKETDTGKTVTLTVANDTGTVQSRVQNFVSAYNSLKGVMTTLGSFNTDAQTAGPLFGDPLLTNIQSQLSRGLTNPVSGAGNYNSLASLGITTNKDGTLTLDTKKLTTALSVSFNSVGVVFGSKDGIAARLSSFVDTQLATTGGITARNQSLTDRQHAIADETTALKSRAQQLTLRYQAQFTAMDSLLSQMQSTSSFLTQQFTNLAKATNSG